MEQKKTPIDVSLTESKRSKLRKIRKDYDQLSMLLFSVVGRVFHYEAIEMIPCKHAVPGGNFKSWEFSRNS